jgi:hypothetical protein
LQLNARRCEKVSELLPIFALTRLVKRQSYV